jgi:hypothetical protein
VANVPLNSPLLLGWFSIWNWESQIKIGAFLIWLQTADLRRKPKIGIVFFRFRNEGGGGEYGGRKDHGRL